MGLFGSKKIYVASTLYNLAGDEEDRVDYLKTTVVGNVISGSNESMGETINRSYLKGPGINFRSFFRWAEDNYDYIGMPKGYLNTSPELDNSVLETYLPVTAGYTPVIQNVQVSLADYSFWAEQWMFANEPTLIETEWTADIDEDTNDITITFEDTTTETFTPTDFDPDGIYVFVNWYEQKEGEAGPILSGSVIDLDPDELVEPWPDVTGWTEESSVTDIPDPTFDLDTVTEVLVEYSDATPDEYSSSTDTATDQPYTEYHAEYTQVTYQGVDPDGDDRTYSLKEYMFFDQTAHIEQTVDVDVVVEDIGGGVTKTTTTTITTDVIVIDRSYHIDEQEINGVENLGPYGWIYRVGSGTPAIDEMLTSVVDDSAEYYPFIPVRRKNEFLSSTHLSTAYALAKKAYKKAIKAKYDELVDSIADSENLDDIDYAYGVFGVSLNVIENSCRKYIYHFFDKLRISQGTSELNYALWESTREDYEVNRANFYAWRAAQEDPGSELYGSPMPSQDSYNSIPSTSIRIKADGEIDFKFDMEIQWSFINEVTGAGLAKPGAKNGEVWFEVNPDATFEETIYIKGVFPATKDVKLNNVRLYWQIDQDNWKALDLVGFVHRNYIYKGKFVEITMKEALEDVEESGFLVPLHYPTYREMSLVDSTQMSTACTFVVFNSYVVKKTGFLGSFFKVFLIVLTIAVVVFAPQLAPAVAQAALATGTAIGLTGVAAVIAGAAINAIAAMIISQLIMDVAISVFGEKLGTIIGTIVVIAANQGFQNFQQTGNFSLNFGNMMSAQNIMKLTGAIGDVYTKFMYYDAMDTLKETQELMDQYEKEQRKLKELYAREFGYGRAVIDPLILTESGEIGYESASAFLSRTLMTGSDIAKMSMDMLSEFPTLTINSSIGLD